MKTIEEALKLDPTEILNEIKERHELIRTMVGWLYPSILADEIVKLHEEYERRQWIRK